MKTKIIVVTASVALFAAGAVAILAATASRATAAQTPSAEASAQEPWSFKEGRGITLSEAARLAVGIRLAPVESADFTPEHGGIAAQIYRSAPESADQKTASASLWIPAAEAAALAPNQAVELVRGEEEFPATVAGVKPAARAGAPAEILLAVSDPGKHLRVGDFLRARVDPAQGKRQGVTTVPAGAVVESVRGDFVYAANGASFLRTPVVLGPRQGDRIEVVDGLFEGDEIVAAGAANLWMIELQAVNGGKGCADGH